MSILPIVTYNDPVLRQKASPIEGNTDQLQTLIDDMFATMYNGEGVGLAAPQIGKTLRLFVVDADTFTSEEEDLQDHGPLVFINPVVKPLEGEHITMDEGCLSIPGIREGVTRPDKVEVSWRDRDFNPQKEVFSGWMSRVIQHEYDHIEGVLFIDYLGSFRKRMLRSRLNAVDAGQAEADYPLLPRTVNAEG